MFHASESDANGDRKNIRIHCGPWIIDDGTSISIGNWVGEMAHRAADTSFARVSAHASDTNHVRTTNKQYRRVHMARVLLLFAFNPLGDTQRSFCKYGHLEKNPRPVAPNDPGSQNERSRLESRHTKAKAFRLSELTSSTRQERQGSAHSTSGCHPCFHATSYWGAAWSDCKTFQEFQWVGAMDVKARQHRQAI